jgi:hypothetical protein
MTAFTIRGRVFLRGAPAKFHVIVSAIPLREDVFAPALEHGVLLRTAACEGRQKAVARRDAMVIAVGRELRAGGHEVRDTEVD